MTLPLRILPLVVCLGAGPVPVSAQSDQGVLIISRGGQEIGRESFRRVPNKSDPSVVDSLTSIARFPATKPALEMSAIWGRSGPDAFTLAKISRKPAEHRKREGFAARSAGDGSDEIASGGIGRTPSSPGRACKRAGFGSAGRGSIAMYTNQTTALPPGHSPNAWNSAF